jgi:hypothetical protein
MLFLLGRGGEWGVYASRWVGVGVFIGSRAQRPKVRARGSLAVGGKERALFSFLMQRLSGAVLIHR